MSLAGLTLPGLFATLMMLATADVAQAGDCPRTLGSSQVLGKPFPSSDSWYGSETLAVILPRDGIWSGMGPSHHYRDKLFWWSAGFKVGDESNLKVSGKRLDVDSPPADISRSTNAYAESLGGWAMLVGVEFPGTGCWQITGEYFGQTLTFVVEVPASEPAHGP